MSGGPCHREGVMNNRSATSPASSITTGNVTVSDRVVSNHSGTSRRGCFTSWGRASSYTRARRAARCPGPGWAATTAPPGRTTRASSSPPPPGVRPGRGAGGGGAAAPPGDVDAGDDARLQPSGVATVAAPDVQHHGRRLGPPQPRQRPGEGVVGAGGEEPPPRRNHLVAVAGAAAPPLVVQQQVDVALTGDVGAVAWLARERPLPPHL